MNPPRFKPLRAYRDPVSAREWNSLTDVVTRLCKSLGVEGVFDSSGLHLRGARSRHATPCHRIQSNDGGGAYTLRPQMWDDATAAFVDRPDTPDVSAREIHGNAAAREGELVEVRMELCLQGEWVGLFEHGSPVLWGAVKADWTAGNSVVVYPCADDAGSGKDTSIEVNCYIHAPTDDAGPRRCRLVADDVVAYLPFVDSAGVARGMLVSPPVDSLPDCDNTQYKVLQRTGDDYPDDVTADWTRAHA